MASENLLTHYPGLKRIPSLEGIDILLLVEQFKEELTEALTKSDDSEEKDQTARILIYAIDSLRLLNQELFDDRELKRLREQYRAAKPKDDSFLFAIETRNEDWNSIIQTAHRIVEEARQTVKLRTELMLEHFGPMTMTEFIERFPDAKLALVRHWKPEIEEDKSGNNSPTEETSAHPATTPS